jgi:hypothetical protein
MTIEVYRGSGNTPHVLTQAERDKMNTQTLAATGGTPKKDDPPKPTETKTDAKPAGDTTTTPTKGESSELGIDVKMQIGGVETSAHFKSNDDFIKLLSEEGAHGINVTVESVTPGKSPVKAGGGAPTETAKPEEIPAAKTEDKTVTVKKGDTLGHIFKAVLGIGLGALKAKNPQAYGAIFDAFVKANPDLFKAGAHGKPRDAEGNKIYPGDQVHFPAALQEMVKKAEGGDAKVKAGGVAPTPGADAQKTIDHFKGALQAFTDANDKVRAAQADLTKAASTQPPDVKAETTAIQALSGAAAQLQKAKDGLTGAIADLKRLPAEQQAQVKPLLDKLAGLVHVDPAKPQATPPAGISPDQQKIKDTFSSAAHDLIRSNNAVVEAFNKAMANPTDEAAKKAYAAAIGDFKNKETAFLAAEKAVGSSGLSAEQVKDIKPLLDIALTANGSAPVKDPS